MLRDTGLYGHLSKTYKNASKLKRDLDTSLDMAGYNAPKFLEIYTVQTDLFIESLNRYRSDLGIDDWDQ